MNLPCISAERASDTVQLPENTYLQPTQRTQPPLDMLEMRIWELMEDGQPCDPASYENIGEAMDCIYEGDRKALVAAVRSEDACEVGKVFLRVVRTHCEDKAQLMAWRGE